MKTLNMLNADLNMNNTMNLDLVFDLSMDNFDLRTDGFLIDEATRKQMERNIS